MVVEPFELNGKTIKDCFFRRVSLTERQLVIEFTDGSEYKVIMTMSEDEISGHDYFTDIEVIKDGM